MSNVTPHPIAILKLSRKVGDVISFGNAVVTAMTNNPSFPNPSPTLAIVMADMSALAVSESAALARTKGAVGDRNAKLAVVHTDLGHLMSYVQTVANAASPSNAEAIILSAGMSVRKTPSRTKGDLEVKLGPVTGSVKLLAKAVARRASYEWQYSTDQKTWTVMPATLQAKTELSGLATPTLFAFRVRGVTKVGEGEWSGAVSLVVT